MRTPWGEQVSAGHYAGHRGLQYARRPRTSDKVVALRGIWSLGAVPVLGNRWWSTREAAHCIALMAPRAVITDAPDLTAAGGVAVLGIAEMRGDGATAPDREVPAVSPR